jgi:cysteine desulfurase / selenocysteine lyase
MAFCRTKGYLDSAASALKPKEVGKAMQEFLTNDYATVHRGLYKRALDATQKYEDARLVVANFLHAKSHEIIFTKSTTESLNAIATMLYKYLTKTQKIKNPTVLLSELEHHANIVPWQQLGFEIKVIPITQNFTLDMNVLEKQLESKNVHIIAITHVSNVTGTCTDIHRICKLAKSHKVISVLDVAQSVAHIPLDVKKVNCDFLAFSGHKIYGPTGIGVLYIKDEWTKNLEPYQFGGNMVENVTFAKSTWLDSPRKFEAGTMPIAEAIGLAVAIKTIYFGKKNKAYVMQKLQIEHKILWDFVLSELAQIPNVRILASPSSENSHTLVSFVLDKTHPHDIVDMLGEKGICVRGSHHCAMPLHNKLGLSGSIRISFGIYTTMQDVRLCMIQLKKILKRYYRIEVCT